MTDLVTYYVETGDIPGPASVFRRRPVPEPGMARADECFVSEGRWNFQLFRHADDEWLEYLVEELGLEIAEERVYPVESFPHTVRARNVHAAAAQAGFTVQQEVHNPEDIS